MVFEVMLKRKGSQTAIQTADCSAFDMSIWCRKGAEMSKNLKTEIEVHFRSQSHVFTFSPDDPEEVIERYLQRNNVENRDPALAIGNGVPALAIGIEDPALAAQTEGS